jgi:CRP-like cAMP-binding protein
MQRVIEVSTDELDVADKAFAGNRLLSAFAPAARALIEPYGEMVELEVGDTVLRRGEHVTASVFPVAQTMISLCVDIGDRRSIEVASIGREGAVGGIVSCGHAPAFSQAAVLVAGPAYKIEMKALEEAKGRSTFISNIFCRFADYLLAQVMQSVACNAFHPITERAAGWLLQAQDRAGDRIELTQEAFAGLLGVQRTTVNAVIRTLQEEGLITTSRGVVRVTDRAGLKRRACACYGTLERHFGAVIGPSGSGGSAGC